MIKGLLLGAAAAITLTSAAHAQNQTGRQLTTVSEPVGETTLAEFPGITFQVQPLVGIFWDERCSSVEYTFNSNQPANAAFPGAEIAPEVLAEVVQAGLDRWNDNPSSYIEMNITAVEDLGDAPRVGGDFVNEVTFITPAGFGALASSPSTSLTADATFVAGDDLDGDGDSDVFDPTEEGINVCSDVDDDGDIEFPAGDYAAGTILDNDVQFGAAVFWELGATNTGGADVDAVSTHEFGHSHGLSHALINQISEDDGTGSTMFPFIDTGDGASELGNRTLHVDDLAASAFIYPEGDGFTPASELQPGDIAFDDAFDVISGTVSEDGFPIAAAAVSMADRRSGEILSQTYSGEVIGFGVLDFFGPGTGVACCFAGPEGIVNGDFNVPVPRGIYEATLEALDGDPAAPGNISFPAILADVVRPANFPEEGWTRTDSDLEVRPGLSLPIPSRRDGIDFVLNDEVTLANFVSLTNIGVGAIGAAEESIVYAESFSAEDVLALLDTGALPVGATFRTGTLDASLVPSFIEARLSVGRINEDGTATITRVLRRDRRLVGQDGDATPFNFAGPQGLAQRLQIVLERDPSLVVFLELESNDVNTVGPSGFPPAFLGFDTNTEIGASYLSLDDGPLSVVTAGNWVVEMRFLPGDEPEELELSGL